MNSNMKSTLETSGKPIICKAAVCRGAGEALVMEDIQVAPPLAWEIRIKILCTSLCHTDLTFWKLHHGELASFPKIFGHESVGIVESVGDNVTEVKQGDTVVPVARPNCQECSDCKSPKSNMCRKFKNKYHNGMPRDVTGRFKDMNGEAIHHFLSVSSFTEYTVVDVIHVVKITSRMPVDKACLLSCGVSTGLGAVWKVAQVEEGSTVAIFGLGTIGLAVAEASRLQRASRIIGIDLNPDKEEIAKRFGVTDFINPVKYGDKKVSQVIKELTHEGADYCFECIGSASVMQEAFESSREGWGKTVILGVEVPGTPMSLSCWDMIRGRTVIGSLFGGIKPKDDIPAFAHKYLNKLRPFFPTIVHRPIKSNPTSELQSGNSQQTLKSMADKSIPSLAEQYALPTEEKPVESRPSEVENTKESNKAPQTQESGSEETQEVKLETAPADFRFPTTNQTRHCFTRYIEYHRCVGAKGEDATECDKFAKFYRSLCPGEWIDRWNEQRENGTFPGPL